MEVIPTISVTPSRLVLYNQFVGLKSSVKNSDTWTDNFKDNNTHGKISISARKKIQRAIDWLIFLSPKKKVYNKKTGKYFRFKINFITLTLPAKQFHDDAYIKKYLLDSFLQRLRSRYNMKFYLWRAEAQDNGNIHFHITTNIFIHWSEIRSIWNKILNNHGYIQHYSRNQKEYFAKGFRLSDNPKDKRGFRLQYKAYIWNQITGFSNPNSTDIHSVKNIKDLSAYLSKYMTKNSDERPIDGRLWFMSSELKKFQTAVDEIDGELSQELSKLFSFYKSKTKSFDYCDVLYLDYNDWKKHDLPQLKDLFNSYFNHVSFLTTFKV